MPSIRVLLADDHPLVRSAIRKLLERAADIEVVGEVGDGFEALHQVEKLAPDVLLLDMEMPGLRGVEVARHLQSQGTPVRILGLSSYDDQHYIQGMLESGAAGYLTKEEAPQMLVQAVRGVARGEEGWFSQGVASKMAARAGKKPARPISLRQHEKDVLRLLVLGKTRRDIAEALSLSLPEVEEHLEAVLAKLGVDSPIEAVIRAVQEGLV